MASTTTQLKKRIGHYRLCTGAVSVAIASGRINNLFQRKRPHWRSSESKSQLLQWSSSLTVMHKSYGSHPCLTENRVTSATMMACEAASNFDLFGDLSRSLCQKYCTGIVQKGMLRIDLAILVRSCSNPSGHQRHSNSSPYFKHALLRPSLGSHLAVTFRK